MENCVLATGGVDDTTADPNNIIFTIKDTKLYVPVVTLSAKDINYENFLIKDLKDRFIGMNIKQKVRKKVQQMSIDSIHIF